jgi:hypothetical protein
VPEARLSIRIKQPPALDRDVILKAIDFDESWVQTVERDGYLF